MPNLHPVFVHFPIVLLTIGFVYDAVRFALKRDDVDSLGWWTQLLGTLSLIPVVLSGLAAKNAVNIPDGARDFFDSHQLIAFLVTALSASLLLWRISARRTLPSTHTKMYLLVSLLTVVLMWIGAWYGGELVYRFGAGVQSLAR